MDFLSIKPALENRNSKSPFLRLDGDLAVSMTVEVI